MPIYEYECKKCHHQFDLMQKISDAPVKQCPKCFEETAVRLVSAAGFQLKGTGWYATDFKNKEKKTTTPATSDKSAVTEKKPAAETPTKTEKKGNKD
ncbi:FmdB family zinc ribbon protein [Legionella jamestowniensis]|uniref:FmdB family transcriptional regulator n=1 Tax=Legionella jamestowniensis TaxID=455 RepID=A0A0W0UK32_9GAMM|nr:zinc ribbon domain-containing protein [Legionella jamestowniensis]KTD08273.1 Zinc ribbon domain protein [Legionella jamestowniensis]OCH98593.1 FmdB family transcriptional regulator [Legionella jamestowniensis]SFL97526.1 putative regulatory protein, FmdB family [Legionella jamestowniensis DSM 19215]